MYQLTLTSKRSRGIDDIIFVYCFKDKLKSGANSAYASAGWLPLDYQGYLIQTISPR